jgi:hypothetical protein
MFSMLQLISSILAGAEAVSETLLWANDDSKVKRIGRRPNHAIFLIALREFRKSPSLARCTAIEALKQYDVSSRKSRFPVLRRF